MRMKRRIVGMILMATLLLTACGSTPTKDVSTKEKNKNINVGIIQFTEHIALDRSREGFIKELEEKGYNVKENTVNVQGDIGLIPATAKKLESDGVDLIYAIATPAAQGAKNTVKDIPIIFNAVTDPVSAGLVESKENPGANVTGVSDFYPVEKQLDKFLEIFPNSKKLGVLYSTGEANSESQINLLREVCKTKGIQLVEVGVASTNDVAQAMSSLVTKIDSYIAITDNLASSSANIIAENLNNAKIPSFSVESGPVENGLLLSDGIDYNQLGSEAADIAIEIMNGKAASSIPVVYSENSKKVVNELSAEKLGIDKNSKLFESAELVK